MNRIHEQLISMLFAGAVAAAQEASNAPDPLAPLRERAELAGQAWQRTNVEVKAELRGMQSNCDPRIAQAMDRLRRSMRAYFDANRFYVERWSEFVAEQQRRVLRNDGGSEAAIRNVTAMRKAEEQDLVSLERRLEALRRNPKASEEVLAEAEALKSQIVSIQQDLDQTGRVLENTRRNTADLQNSNQALADSLKQRLLKVGEDAASWDTSYSRVLSTYQNRCEALEKK